MSDVTVIGALAALDRVASLVDDVDHSDEADISEVLSRLRLLSEPRTNLAVTVTPGEFEVTKRLEETWPAGVVRNSEIYKTSAKSILNNVRLRKARGIAY